MSIERQVDETTPLSKTEKKTSKKSKRQEAALLQTLLLLFPRGLLVQSFIFACW